MGSGAGVRCQRPHRNRHTRAQLQHRLYMQTYCTDGMQCIQRNETCTRLHHLLRPWLTTSSHWYSAVLCAGESRRSEQVWHKYRGPGYRGMASSGWLMDQVHAGISNSWINLPPRGQTLIWRGTTLDMAADHVSSHVSRVTGSKIHQILNKDGFFHFDWKSVHGLVGNLNKVCQTC